MIYLSREYQFRQSTSLGHCCGIVTLCNFSSIHINRENNYTNYLIPSATGLYEVSFVNDLRSLAFYKELCKTLTLLYQSPVRRRSDNANTKIFTCIFSSKDRMK